MTIIEHEISFGSKEICKMTLVAIKLDIFIQNVVERMCMKFSINYRI